MSFRHLAQCSSFALVLLAGAVPVLADDPPKPVNLQVTATDFKNTKGQAIFALYDSKGAWLKLEKALRVVKVPISGGSVDFTFKDVPAGVYAVSVIHDENSNGKLDMHWFPVPGPDEGAGVSNDATATIGPPSYNDSKFRLTDAGGRIRLKIRY